MNRWRENKIFKMSTNSHVKKKVTAALAVIFLLPALIFFIMWTSIGMRFPGLSNVDKQEAFLDYFSGIFSNVHVINVISIVLCLVAIILASRSFQKRLLWLRLLMLITVLICIFIILFNVSQLVTIAYWYSYWMVPSNCFSLE